MLALDNAVALRRHQPERQVPDTAAQRRARVRHHGHEAAPAHPLRGGLRRARTASVPHQTVAIIPTRCICQ